MSRTPAVDELIRLTKSASGVSGPSLAKAHIALGEMLGESLRHLDPEDTTVVAILRGGMFFAQGIYFSLGCKFQLYDPRAKSLPELGTSNVILADSVINTGRTVLEIWEPGMLVACCVASREAAEVFEDCLHTVRVSDNSFVGSRVAVQSGGTGPDTTLRLFNQI